jgi:hypothetical protein
MVLHFSITHGDNFLPSNNSSLCDSYSHIFKIRCFKQKSCASSINCVTWCHIKVWRCVTGISLLGQMYMFIFHSPITFCWKAARFSSKSGGNYGKEKFFHKQRTNLSASHTHTHTHTHTHQSLLALKWCLVILCDLINSCALYLIASCITSTPVFLSSAKPQQFPVPVLVNVHAWDHWKISVALPFSSLCLYWFNLSTSASATQLSWCTAVTHYLGVVNHH